MVNYVFIEKREVSVLYRYALIFSARSNRTLTMEPATPFSLIESAKPAQTLTRQATVNQVTYRFFLKMNLHIAYPDLPKSCLK